jgi:hypothetical protein
MNVATYALPILAQGADICDVAPIAKVVEDTTCTTEQVCGDTFSTGHSLSEKDTLSAKSTMYSGNLIGLETDTTISFNNDACK